MRFVLLSILTRMENKLNSLNLGYSLPKTPNTSSNFTGGTLDKDLNLDGNKLLNLPAPTEDHHCATKKYTDDALSLKMDKAGDSMSGPRGMGGGKLWDLGAPNLDSNATNKKYVDDVDNLKLNKAGDCMSGNLDMVGHKIVKLDNNPTDSKNASNKIYVDAQITTLTSTVNDKISDIDVVDGTFTAGADTQIRVGSNTVNCHQNKLLTTYISNMVEKHFHLTYNGQATGFGITGGKAVVVWGGFNSIDGRCTFASIRLRGMGWRPLTKIQLFFS